MIKNAKYAFDESLIGIFECTGALEAQQKFPCEGIKCFFHDNWHILYAVKIHEQCNVGSNNEKLMR